MVIRSQRPPSSAGIGRTFIQARLTEIRAARKAMSEAEPTKAGKIVPSIPTIPVTPCPASEICSLPCSRVEESRETWRAAPVMRFQSIFPNPTKVSLVSWAVVPSPTRGADQV